MTNRRLAADILNCPIIPRFLRLGVKNTNFAKRNDAMVKILWVDDEVELLKPHVLFLRGKGYEVETCNNGYDAIDMAAEGAYDLIILDEMMPGMTGLETLQIGRAHV